MERDLEFLIFLFLILLLASFNALYKVNKRGVESDNNSSPIRIYYRLLYIISSSILICIYMIWSDRVSLLGGEYFPITTIAVLVGLLKVVQIIEENNIK